MAIPIKGEALVSVGAGEFTLAFTLGASAAIEGQFPGRGLQSILRDIEGDDPKISTLLVVIWALLKKHHAMTLDAVGELVTLAELPAWGAALGQAIAGGATKVVGEARPRKAAPTR